MKKKFGNFVHDNEDSVEFYSSRDILSARTLNRPLLKIFDTEEALTKYLEATVKTLYNKKGNFILPGYLEEFSSFTTGVINKRNYLRIPTGALVINERLIFIKPNCESFERELAKAYGLNLNDYDNNITVSYECLDKQLNYKIKTTYISFDTNKTFETSGNSIFEIINEFDNLFYNVENKPLKQSLELLIDITELEDGKYNLCYNNKFELSESNENKIAEITFENKEIVNCNVLISVADLNEIEFYNLKVENDNYSLSINEDGLNITASTTNINSNINITGDTTLNNLTVNAESVTLGNLIAGNTTLNSLTASDAELNNLTACNTTLDNLTVKKDTELNSLKAGNTTLDILTVDNDTELDRLTVGNTTLDSLTADDTTLDNLTAGVTTLNNLSASNTILDSLTVEKDTTLNNLTVNNDSTLNNLTAGGTTLDSLTVENNTTLDSLTVNNDTVLNNLTAGDTTLGSLTVNAEVVTLNSLKVDEISPKTENLTINGTADRAIADVNGNNIDTTYLKIDDQLCYEYTYIVDSNQKLEDWANNVAGNDYTKVLIKSGTWENSKGVNLTTTDTKVVVGEPGNLLKFSFSTSGEFYGLHYNSTPDSLDYYMTGVNVECSASGNGISASGFYNCTNLTNCSGKGTGNSGSYNGWGFNNCTNLTNCTGSGGNYTGSSYTGFAFCNSLTNCSGKGTGDDSGYGFAFCNNLTNCTGSGNGYITNGYGFMNCTNLANCTGTGSGSGIFYISYGFYDCINLTNCKGNGRGNDRGYGFSNCDNLTNCTGSGYIYNDSGRSYGFYDCTNLTNCTGEGDGDGQGYGFNSCINLTNCNGSSGDYTTSGSGFSDCKGMITCNGTVENCYASQDTTIPASSTPEGGFNS